MMKFRRREKTVLIMTLILFLTIAGAWTWDILTQSDEDSGTIGKPAELVLEKSKDASGALVPQGSYFNGQDGYDTEHIYDYTLTSGEIERFAIDVNFSLEVGGLDESEVYTALEPKLTHNGDTYTLTEGENALNLDMGASGDVTLTIGLNEDLKGSGIGIGRIANNDYTFNIEFLIPEGGE